MNEPLEAFDELASQLAQRGRSICVNSVSDNPSTVALFLAERLVNSGHSCVMLECNTDEPRLWMLTGTQGQEWQEDVVAMVANANKQPNGLAVIAPSIALPIRFRNERWYGALLEACLQAYDRIVISAAPVLNEHLTSPPPGMLAQIAETSILITRARVDTQAQLVRARDLLQPAGDKLCGIVINDADNPALAELLIQEVDERLQQRPVLAARLREWLRQAAILNIEY